MDQDLAFSDNRPDVTPARRPVEAPPASAETTIVDPAEHNVVFTTLVTGDQDVVGLVAYSIYKQNKYDWLMAFNHELGRMPNEAEVHSYLLGESTTRRLATYRHLAEATLDGRGIEVPGVSSSVGKPRAGVATPRSEPAAPVDDGSKLQRIVLIAVIAVIIAILGLLWLMHGGSATK